jgi:ABC-type amino acid transport substrate-binding protein
VTVATAAEPLRLPPALSPKADSNRSGSQDIAQRNDAAKNTARAAPAPPDNPDLLVAVLMARPETKSVADLAGKTIAIDDRYAKSSSTVRTAIVAAGATEVQLSEGTTTAINRLTNGEVPAAVVALVSPDATETFPDIKGFKIFHVPLSPRAARGRP